jgi:uncharacterized protein
MSTDKTPGALERRGRELGLTPREHAEDKLQIDEIPDEGLLLHLRRRADWLALDVPVLAGVDAWLLLFRIGQEVSADVEGESTLQLECSRCLKEISFPVQMQLRSMYLPLKEEELAEETELANDDLGVTFYRKPEISLPDLFRDELILSIPLKPLCSTDCPGLCPSCGADLAAGGCGCPAAPADARLSPLAELLEKMRGTSGDSSG